MTQLRFAIVGAFTPTSELIPLAKAADALGYDSLSLGDHVVDIEHLETAYPYTADGLRRWDLETEWPDPWCAISALAAVTERLEFFTCVYIASMRSPFQVAKSISTAAALSGGRVKLGAGVGWCREEFDLLQSDFGSRGRRTDESLDLMRRLWSEDSVESAGPHYPAPRLTMRPLPPTRIPILIGGLSDVALRRAARFDGWVGDIISTAEAAAVTKRLRELRPDDAPAPEVIVALNDAIVPEDFAAAAEAGVTEVMSQPWRYYYGRNASIDEKIDGLHRFKEDILTPLRR
jgi:probable F420-dependent oxidoreductase